MRKLVYFIAQSIDGFIAAPDGSWDFFGAQDDVLAYLTAHYPDTLPTAFRGADQANQVFDTVLMGRRTYEPALQAGITSPYAHLEQIVFSRTLTTSPDPAVRIVTGDPVEFVGSLKQEPGKDIWLCGGGEFAGQLLPAIDELVIKLNPVVAGGGIPLAARGFDPHQFCLLDVTPLDSGVLVLRYQAA
ncbi:dihydrofolate reductase family protein [Actinoplanes sp. NPDC051859]|uniref:dihydrofolate reductase family protein n=1 Tax=Actinoplanes sp. NPDC051859 TaxID=3363909 RepID=UPI0037A754B5